MPESKRNVPANANDEGDAARAMRAERRRSALRDVLANADMNPTEAARVANLKSANAIFNFLGGRSEALSQSTLEKLAAAIPGASLAALSGIDPSDNAPPAGARAVQVRAAAVAGLMQASFDLPLRQQEQVYMPIAEDHHASGAFGVRVREPGAENLYPAGTLLACVALNAWEGTLRDGNKLILQRIAGGRVEVTVRQVAIQANEAWLWLRTTHPEHQAPVRMPYIPGQPPQSWRDGEVRYTVAGVVVLACVPEV